METTLRRDGNISYAVTDNFFTPQELALVKKEIQTLDKFLTAPDKTNTAFSPEDRILKDGSGVFLDEIYSDNRKNSAILNACRKLFSLEYISTLAEFDLIFDLLRQSNRDSTLLNKYCSQDQYRRHVDISLISSVIMLEGNRFYGGDFILGDRIIPFKNNRAVTFPSMALHGCTPVEGDGVRYSIAVFADRGLN